MCTDCQDKQRIQGVQEAFLEDPTYTRDLPKQDPQSNMEEDGPKSMYPPSLYPAPVARPQVVTIRLKVKSNEANQVLNDLYAYANYNGYPVEGADVMKVWE